MKKRSLLAMIGLTIITLGLYQLYWLIATRREMVERGHRIPSVWLLLSPILALLAVAFLQFVVAFVLSNNANVGSLSAIVNIISILIGVAATISIFIVTFYWFYHYCKAVAVVTNNEMEFTTSYIIWIVLNVFSLGFIWPLVIQYSFNHIATPLQYSDQPVPSATY